MAAVAAHAAAQAVAKTAATRLQRKWRTSFMSGSCSVGWMNKAY
jgi:hypothetical protein